ncbi:MAG: DNA primase [Desulfobacterales bacterium]|nr:DNA primase [Desulfobacterales bacterium]
MAPFIPEEKITEIRDTCNIVDIVGESVVLKKAGQNYVGLCPFHTEKTPSFTVSDHKQMYYCFGCGEGGNVFSFLMKHQGLSFPEAVKQLAERYGIQLPRREMSPEQKRRLSEREQMFQLNRLAMEFFRHVLRKDKIGAVARDYLKKRGFSADTATAFNIGYAPPGWDHLLGYVKHKRMPVPLAERVGLVVRRQSGQGHYDRFRGRIIFPICDSGGRVIAFGGRVLNDDLPKYLNSPESEIYSKSRSLYGLDVARHHCRSSEQVYIVEGYFDVIALHQHGIREAVATLGTSLTHDHVHMVQGLVGANGCAFLVFDSDEAGIKAARRSVALFEKGFVDARILVLPTGHDPDSFVFQHGADKLRELAAEAKGLMKFLIDSAVSRHGLSMEGRIRVLDEMAPSLAVLTDPGARSIYIKYLAETVDIDEAAILEKINQVAGRSKPGEAREGVRRQSPAEQPGLALSQGSPIERQLVAMMLQFPEILPEMRKLKIVDMLDDPVLRGIGQDALDGREHPAPGESGDASEYDFHRRLKAQLSIQQEDWDYRGCMRIIRHFVSTKRRQASAPLDAQIKQAEKDRDDERLQQLLKEKQEQVIRVRNQQGAVGISKEVD